MTGLDAKFLYSETPTAHMHTVKVAVSDVSADRRRFSYESCSRFSSTSSIRLPPFRRRAVPVPLGPRAPGLGRRPEFDLSRHVSRRVLEDPGSDHQLAAAVADFAGVALRRDRPLWELWSSRGLAGGRIAVVAKIHHAVADGSAAVALLQTWCKATTFEATQEPPPLDPWRPESVPEPPPVADDGRARPRQPLEGAAPPGSQSVDTEAPCLRGPPPEFRSPGHPFRSITSPRRPSTSRSLPNEPLP